MSKRETLRMRNGMRPLNFCSDNWFPLSNVKALVALLTLDSIVFYRCHAPLPLPKSKLRSYLVNTFYRFPHHDANHGAHVLLISQATRQIHFSTPWSSNNRFLNFEAIFGTRRSFGHFKLGKKSQHHSIRIAYLETS